MSVSHESPIASIGVVESAAKKSNKLSLAGSATIAGAARTGPSREIVSGPGPGRSASGDSTRALKKPSIRATAGSAPGQACVGWPAARRLPPKAW